MMGCVVLVWYCFVTLSQLLFTSFLFLAPIRIAPMHNMIVNILKLIIKSMLGITTDADQDY